MKSELEEIGIFLEELSKTTETFNQEICPVRDCNRVTCE
jgi:hypothetical protein